MKYLCDIKKFIGSIYYKDDREAAQKYFESKPGMNLVLVSLPNAKTLSQNAAIWRDWSIAGEFLHLTKEEIYCTLRLADEFSDLFLIADFNRRTGEEKLRYRGLSEFDKIETSEFIPRYREYLQSWIDGEYGETMLVEWSRDEEKERQYIESRFGDEPY